MTLVALIVAFQDAGLTQREGWIAAVCGLVPTLLLVWEKLKKSQAEREASQVAGYKDMLDRQTVTLAKAEATIVALNVEIGKKGEESGREIGRLRDELTAQKVNAANLRGEAKYLRKELRKANGEDESDEPDESDGPDGPDEPGDPTAEGPCRPAS